MKALQTDTGLSLLMIDVDHFKMFNDTYGHPEGDVCLKRIGEVLDKVANETSGYAARYGGEEFCLLLPDSDLDIAMEVGEHIRSKIEQLAIEHSVSSSGIITVSIGVASIVPVESQEDDDLVEAADAALYAAKRRGRNTVVAHGLIRSAGEDVSLAS
jgi:diguanylate cyclase (GGDEF)-like protein